MKAWWRHPLTRERLIGRDKRRLYENYRAAGSGQQAASEDDAESLVRQQEPISKGCRLWTTAKDQILVAA
jgi:hypothetical protein